MTQWYLACNPVSTHNPIPFRSRYKETKTRLCFSFFDYGNTLVHSKSNDRKLERWEDVAMWSACSLLPSQMGWAYSSWKVHRPDRKHYKEHRITVTGRTVMHWLSLASSLFHFGFVTHSTLHLWLEMSTHPRSRKCLVEEKQAEHITGPWDDPSLAPCTLYLVHSPCL